MTPKRGEFWQTSLRRYQITRAWTRVYGVLVAVMGADGKWRDPAGDIDR